MTFYIYKLNIEINTQDIEPIILVEQLIKKYPKRNNEFKSRLMSTYYYLIHSNIGSNENVTLTESEINDNFYTSFIPLNKAT